MCKGLCGLHRIEQIKAMWYTGDNDLSLGQSKSHEAVGETTERSVRLSCG